MLSENVEKILSAENQRRENLKNAEEAAASAEKNAEALGENIVAEKLKEADAEAEKIIAFAKDKADKIFSEERAKCSAEAERLKTVSRKKERIAVRRIKDIIF